jgi:hypothetical protein
LYTPAPFGAVNVAEFPTVEIVPPVAEKFTAELDPDTVALKTWVRELELNRVTVEGVIANWATLTMALEDLVESATLVAVTEYEPTEVGAV